MGVRGFRELASLKLSFHTGNTAGNQLYWTSLLQSIGKVGISISTMSCTVLGIVKVTQSVTSAIVKKSRDVDRVTIITKYSRDYEGTSVILSHG